MCCSVAAMAVIDTKLVPVLIEKLQTELDEIKVSLKYLGAIYRVTTCLESLTKLGICKVNIREFTRFRESRNGLCQENTRVCSSLLG